jgi:1-acyl-sn-glycerol-3-phosphate acyltransferase
MFKSLIQGMRGVISILLYTVNTILICIPIFAVAIVKLLLPLKPIQIGCRRILTALANGWIAVNRLNQRLFNGVRWDVRGLENLDPKGWYMVVANHQSWVDILVLQTIFYRKIPFLKFFLKKELFWFPLLGQAWWALDFPFMKRYSRHFLKKNPHLIGKDLEITKRACDKFRNIPVSVMNFVEGSKRSRLTSKPCPSTMISWGTTFKTRSSNGIFKTGSTACGAKKMAIWLACWPAEPDLQGVRIGIKKGPLFPWEPFQCSPTRGTRRYFNIKLLKADKREKVLIR